jgi:lipopolysaccharide export system protein LptA
LLRAYALSLIIVAILSTAAIPDSHAQSSISKAVAPSDSTAAADSAVNSGGDSSGSSAKSDAQTSAKTATSSNPFGAMGFSTDNGPINIKSDSMDLDYKQNHVTFRGHVHAVQSGTTLVSDTLAVTYMSNQKDPSNGRVKDQVKPGRPLRTDPKGDPGSAGMNQIKEVTALGHVKIDQGGRYATGDKAVFNQINRTVEMTGSPVVHDGPDQIAGTKILIYLDTQKSVVEGAHAVIFPRKSENGDNSAPSKDHSP